MTDKATEKELARLRRLPENKVCPNCGRKDTLFGFSAVCWQFKTFVCGDCKSAHQSFSHRCKSVTMSNWDMAEVMELDERNGGGNKLAYEKWVSRAPASAVPDDKSSLDTIKRFIDRAYNQKAWEGPATGSAQRGDERDDDRRGSRRQAAGPENHVIGGGPRDNSDSPACRRAPDPMPAPPRAWAAAPVSAPPVPAAQVTNLLDMFDEPVAAPAPRVAATPAPAFQAAFDPSASAPQPASFDPFAAGAPATAAAPPAFDPFALSGGIGSQAAPVAAAAPSVDPFAAGFAQPQPQQQQASNAFAFTNAQQPQQLQQPQQGMGAVGGSAFGFLGGGYAGNQAPAAPWPQSHSQPMPHRNVNGFAGAAPMGGGMGMGAMGMGAMGMGAMGMGAMQQQRAPMQGGMGAAGWQMGQQQNPQVMMQMQQQQQHMQMQQHHMPMQQQFQHQHMQQMQQPQQSGIMSAGMGGMMSGMQMPSASPPLPQQSPSSSPGAADKASDMFDPFAPAGAGARSMAVHA